MLMTALRSLWAHKMRLLATALSITLGVAFMAGTLVLTATMRQTFNDLSATLYRNTSVVVRAKAAFEGPQGVGTYRGRISQALLPAVRAVPGVSVAEGSVTGYARLIGRDGQALGNPAIGAPTLGVSWAQDSAFNSLRLATGTAPRANNDVVIDRKSARDGRLAVGDVTTVLAQGGPQRVRIAGIARFGTADSPAGATIVAFRTPVAQRVLGEVGQFDQINIAAAHGVSASTLAARVAAILPAGDEAVTGKVVTAETQTAFHKALSFFYTFLLIFAAVAVLVGGFMVFNTFSITVAQRARENGLLRALGVSRRQVLASVLLEALVVGTIASLIGLGAGLGIALGLRNLLKAVGLDVPTVSLVITASTVVISLGVGIGVTVASALSPARKAARVPPIAAMQLGVTGSSGYGSKRRMCVGAGVLGLGVAALVIGLFAHPPRPFEVVAAGAVLTFFGVSILGRTVSLPLSRFIGYPLARLRGVTGELARENAMRNPRRTAASASALMVGVGLVGFITIFVASTRASVNSAIDRGFTGDIVVDSGGGTMGGVDPGLARRLAVLPEVTTAAGLRQGVARVAGTTTVIQAGDPHALLSLMNIDVRQGSTANLDATGIGVYSRVAKEKHWHVGSLVPVIFAKTGREVLHVAVIYERNAQAGNYFLGTAAYDANFASPLDAKVFVKVRSGVSASVALAAVKKDASAYPGVKILDRSQYKAEQVKPLNQLLALVYALLALAIVIALLGIGNTLALSITERIRELGLLRAVGMTRGQLRSAIRWEAVLIALQGTALGLAIGVFFGWALTAALHDQGVTVFRVPITSMLVIVVLAGVAGAMAAVIPGRRAARLDILRALASD